MDTSWTLKKSFSGLTRVFGSILTDHYVNYFVDPDLGEYTSGPADAPPLVSVG